MPAVISLSKYVFLVDFFCHEPGYTKACIQQPGGCFTLPWVQIITAKQKKNENDKKRSNKQESISETRFVRSPREGWKENCNSSSLNDSKKRLISSLELVRQVHIVHSGLYDVFGM
jgi:hypothetical protein